MEKIFKAIIGPIVSGVVVGLIFFFIIQNYSNRNQADILTDIMKIKEDLSAEKKNNQKRYDECCRIVHNASSSETKPMKNKNKKEEEENWLRILDISWVKNKIFGINHRLDLTQYASSDPEKLPFYVSVKHLDKTKALVIVENKKNGNSISREIKKGNSAEFNLNKNNYKLSIVNIRKAGFGSSLAMFFTIDIKINPLIADS